MNKTAPFSMRLDPALKKRLQKLADKERRTLTNYIESKLYEIADHEEKVVNLNNQRRA
jgi:predicted transcriptional regulator